jgi:transposase-like protein
MKPKRTLTPEFKFNLVLETFQGEKKIAEIAREYDIHPQLITTWRRIFLREGPKIFANKKEERKKDHRIEELEKIIGRQTIEIQFLKKVLGHLG